MKVGRDRHPRVWFAAAPPGGPRSNPVGYYGPPGSGPRGTRKREKPVARWTGAYLSSASALARHAPSLWGNGKRDGLSRARTKSGTSIALAMRSFDRMRARCTRRSTVLSPFVPAQAGTQTFEKPVCLALGPRLRGDERREVCQPTFFRITACYEQ